MTARATSRSRKALKARAAASRPDRHEHHQLIVTIFPMDEEAPGIRHAAIAPARTGSILGSWILPDISVGFSFSASGDDPDASAESKQGSLTMEVGRGEIRVQGTSFASPEPDGHPNFRRRNALRCSALRLRWLASNYFRAAVIPLQPQKEPVQFRGGLITGLSVASL